jgi:hypothetical protein
MTIIHGNCCVEKEGCACERERVQALVASGSTAVEGFAPAEVINIPIVFHCCGNASEANDPDLTDFQLGKQVEQLNLDFRALNSDYTSKCPTNMLNLRHADTKINFYIQDVRRVYTAALGNYYHTDLKTRHRLNKEFETMKKATFGSPAVSAATAMNVWCCRYTSGGEASDPILSSGYAYLPDGTAPNATQTMHIVVQSFCIGSVSHPAPSDFWGIEFSTGRILTHEVGHFLGLNHSWGPGPEETDLCVRDENISDLPYARGAFHHDMNVTPPALYNRGCGGEPYNNHMNYGAGRFQSAFTPAQAAHMRNAFLFNSLSRQGAAIRPVRVSELHGANWGASAAVAMYMGGQKLWPTAPAPGAPTLTARRGSARVTLSWTAPSVPSGSQITGYSVQYKASSSTTWLSHSHSGTSTSTVVSGLVNGTAYSFRAAAISNNGGQGEWSNIATATPVASTAQPGAPALTAAGEEQSVSLVWTAPTAPPGESITAYRVEQSTNAASWALHPTSGASTSTVVPGLTNGQQYYFRVAAIAENQGPYSNIASATPSAPFLQPVEGCYGAGTSSSPLVFNKASGGSDAVFKVLQTGYYRITYSVPPSAFTQRWMLRYPYHISATRDCSGRLVSIWATGSRSCSSDTAIGVSGQQDVQYHAGGLWSSVSIRFLNSGYTPSPLHPSCDWSITYIGQTPTG